MSSETAFSLAMFAGWLAICVWIVWPSTSHKCRYPRCPHKGEQE